MDPGGTVRDTGVRLAAGSSPALAPLADGEFEVAAHEAGSDQLLTIGPSGVVRGGSITLAAGTRPTISIGGFGGPVVATVPNVIGMSQATEQDVLAVAGLSLGPITWDTHCLDVAGAVLGQDPQAAGSFPGATFRLARQPT